MEKITGFIKEVIAEAKNITWPTKKQATYSTVAVIIVSLLVAYYLGILDKLFSKLLQLLLLYY